MRALPTRDAVLPLLCVLCESRRAGTGVAGLVGGLPPRRTATGLLRGVPPAAAGVLFEELDQEDGQGIRRHLGRDFGAVAGVDRTDGLRIRFCEGTILHLRPSGNAPEFRIYVETDSTQACRRALRRALRIVGGLLRHAGRA